MVYFSLWKQDNFKDANTYYDCFLCQRKGQIEDRVCFKYRLTDPEDTVNVKIPEIDDDTGRWISITDVHISSLTKNELLEELDDVERFDQMITAFDYLVLGKKGIPSVDGKEICVVGLMDESAWDVIALEAICSSYSMSPCYPSAVDHQPPVLLQLFTIIRAERNRYEAIKMERERMKTKS